MLSIEARSQYLVLHDVVGTKTKRVCIELTLDDAIKEWTSGSRLSPVWPIKGRVVSRTDFKRKQWLLFAGPVQPALVFESVRGLTEPDRVHGWLTAGCFNVLLRFTDEEAALLSETQAWLASQSIACETWLTEGGQVIDQNSVQVRSMQGDVVLDNLVAELSKLPDGQFIRPALQEYVINTATALARAASVHPPTFASLKQVTEAGCATLAAYTRGEVSPLELQSRMLSINAAMSRFSSQAFSGVPPIQATECHFWVHSLLGTGSANIALANLVGAIQSVLGEARLPERLLQLKLVKERVPTKDQLISDPSLLSFDLMQKTAHLELPSAPVIPLVTYFSGRDGFSSQVQTLSAPLATIAECNSLRSNILTVTHEISHIFIQATLATLAPNLGDVGEMETARRIAAPHFTASNHIEAARQLVVEAAISMEQAKYGLLDERLNDQLQHVFSRWRREMQEIMVHTFDFLYFHQGDPAFYVTSIWHSWCAIPGISDRVPEYLMRTMAAISASFLETPSDQIFGLALNKVTELLKKVESDIDPKNDYVRVALQIASELESNVDLRRSFEQDFAARNYLVRLVRIYLFSETIAAQLFQNPFARSSVAAVAKPRLNYNRDALGNCLEFLREHLNSSPSEAESIWILHTLAFDLYRARRE